LDKKKLIGILMILSFAVSVFAIESKIYVDYNFMGNKIYNLSELTVGTIFTNLVGYWGFDENENITAYDYSNYGNDGILTNGTTWTTGMYRNALDFNSTAEQYVDCGNDDSLNFGSGDFSVSLWVKYTYSAGDPIGKYLDSEDKGFIIGFTSTNVDFYIYDSVNDADAIDAYNPSLNTWYHLVGVRGGGRAKLYINGELEANVDASSVGNIDTTGNLTIGKYTDGTYFNGTIDEVRIYNKALTAEEIKKDYYKHLYFYNKTDTNYRKYSDVWVNSSFFNGSYYGDASNAILSTTFLPEVVVTLSGTYDDGNVTSIQTVEEGFSYNVSEDTGAEPLIVQINFTGLTTFDSVVTRLYYEGGMGHEIQFEILRTDTGSWENYFEITDTNDFVNVYVPVLDPQWHVGAGGNVSVRFYHVQSGIPTHNFFLDYIALVDGITTLTTMEHDGLSGRDNKENHPWAFPTDASRNVTGQLNITNATKIGDGGICWNGTGIIITGNFSKYCG